MKKRILLSLIVIGGVATATAQNVGISTSAITPDASSILELRSTTSGFLLPRMTQVQKDAIAGPTEGLLVYQSNGASGFKYYDGSAWTVFGGGADNFGSHIAEANLQLDDYWLSNDGGNEGIRIDDNGNVGIGTSSPDRLLNIGDPSGPEMLLTREDNSTQNGDVLGELIFDSTDDTTPSTNDGSAVIRATASENHGNGNKGGHLSFLTKQSGTSENAAATERMRVTHNGNVGIGITSPNNTLDVAGTTETDAIRITTGAVSGHLLRSDASGNATWTDPATLGLSDDLGDHTATQNIETSGNWISGDGGNEGVFVNNAGNVGVGTSSPSQKLHVEGNIRIGANGYMDDDATLGGNSDDWLRLRGYIEMKSNSDNYGIVLRDKDNTNYFGLTQKNGWSYLADNTSSSNYFLRGNGANIEVRGDITVRGGDIYDNSGDLKMSGEDNVYISMDYNNNDNNTRSIRFGTNSKTASSELMRIEEGGDVGISTTNPGYKLHVRQTNTGAGDVVVNFINTSNNGLVQFNDNLGLNNRYNALESWTNKNNSGGASPYGIFGGSYSSSNGSDAGGVYGHCNNRNGYAVLGEVIPEVAVMQVSFSEDLGIPVES